MGFADSLWSDPVDYLRAHQPEDPVLFLSPAALQAQARRFLSGFPGLVTYAVKANPDETILANLAAAGITGFDVASPEEIALVRRLIPGAALHYNNPVRARAEIALAVAQDVASYSVDSHSELDKLIALVPPRRAPGMQTEIAVRFKLPVAGAAYDFGAKFGAEEGLAAALLDRVTKAGFAPALTFHPGTQCQDPAAWEAYIRAARRIAGPIRLSRLNTGGGFPSRRHHTDAPPLDAIFATIARTTAEVFGPDAPTLVCEPGRAMVADAMALAARVKALRDDGPVFLNDGIYGAFAELPSIGTPDRLCALSPEGHRRTGAPRPRIVFGPTCDSLDRLPGEPALPEDLAEGDYLLVQGMGAYSAAIATRFNGFGAARHHLVLDLGA